MRASFLTYATICMCATIGDGFISLIPAAAEDTGVDLKTVLAGHKAAREKLRSAHARVTAVVGHSAADRQRTEVEWWHDGDSCRYTVFCSPESAQSQSKIVVREELGILRGNAKRLLREPKLPDPVIVAQASLNDRSVFTTGSIWSAGMFCVNNQFGRYYEDEIVDPNIFTDVTVVRDESLIRVSAKISHGHWRDIWFDPKWNYLITRKADRSLQHPDKIASVTEARTVSEIAPGIFFPTHVIMKNFDLMGETKIEFLSVNEPVADESLVVRIPENTLVSDVAAGVRYVTDVNGNPKSTPTPIRKPPAHRAAPTSISPAQIPVPTSRWRWWGVAAALVAIVGAGFYFRRRSLNSATSKGL